jgi:hypothetical protein
MRALLFLPFLLALSGCWTSEKPLMTEAVMDGLPLSGSYAKQDGSSADADDLYAVETHGKHYALSLPVGQGKFELNYTLGLDQLRDEYYLGQLLGIKGGIETYRLFKIDDEGDEIEVLDFPCEKVETLLSGVQTDGENCQFSDYPTLKFAATERARRWDETGEGATPIATYRRQILDADEAE